MFGKRTTFGSGKMGISRGGWDWSMNSKSGSSGGIRVIRQASQGVEIAAVG